MLHEAPVLLLLLLLGSELFRRQIARAVNDMTVGVAAKDFKEWCLCSNDNIGAWPCTIEGNGLLEKTASLYSKAHFFSLFLAKQRVCYVIPGGAYSMAWGEHAHFSALVCFLLL